jgi:hypothetical protein
MKQGDGKTNYGFIAQDIEKLVGTNNGLLTIGADTARTLGLRYTDFIAPMVKAMQELSKQNSQLISTTQELSKQNSEMKEEIAKLISAIDKLKQH